MFSFPRPSEHKLPSIENQTTWLNLLKYYDVNSHILALLAEPYPFFLVLLPFQEGMGKGWIFDELFMGISRTSLYSQTRFFYLTDNDESVHGWYIKASWGYGSVLPSVERPVGVRGGGGGGAAAGQRQARHDAQRDGSASTQAVVCDTNKHTSNYYWFSII